MQCCKKPELNKENSANQGQQPSCDSGRKHMLMMILCCMTPMGAILLLKLSGYEGTASYLFFLLCPLMHFFMMRGMKEKREEPTAERIQQN